MQRAFLMLFAMATGSASAAQRGAGYYVAGNASTAARTFDGSESFVPCVKRKKEKGLCAMYQVRFDGIKWLGLRLGLGLGFGKLGE
jgi:hypothetical protein